MADPLKPTARAPAAAMIAAPLDEATALTIANRQLSVRAPTDHQRAVILTAANIERIARAPGLLASAYGVSLPPSEFFDRLRDALDSGIGLATSIDLVTPAALDQTGWDDPETAPTATLAAAFRAPVTFTHVPQTFWSALLDVLLEMISLGFARTRLGDDIIDTDQRHDDAMVMAYAGGHTLQRAMTSGVPSEVVGELRKLLVRIHPGRPDAEYDALAKALHRDLADIYAAMSVPALENLRGVLREQPLTATDRARLTALINSSRAPLVDVLLASQAYRSATAADQHAMLVHYLEGLANPPRQATRVPAEVSAPYSLSGPVEVGAVDFESRRAPALAFTIKIDKREIPLLMPRTDNMNMPSAHQVADAVAKLPAVIRSFIVKIRSNPNPNPQDAQWAKAYGINDFQSYMTAGVSGVIDIYRTDDTFSKIYIAVTLGMARVYGDKVVDYSLTHETGHIVSQRRWGEDTTSSWWSGWRDAMARDGRFASDYATSSVNEDFAETFALYLSVHGTPRESAERARMPERFSIIARLLALHGNFN